MPVFATPEPISVTLDVAAANVRFIASDRDDTVVEVRPSRPSRSGDVRAAEQAEIEFADGRLRVRTTRSWRTWLPVTESVDVTIELPSGSDVMGDHRLRQPRAEGRLGVRVKTGAGDITLDQAGPLDLRTGAGTVSIAVASGTWTSSASGSVRIRRSTAAPRSRTPTVTPRSARSPASFG